MRSTLLGVCVASLPFPLGLAIKVTESSSGLLAVDVESAAGFSTAFNEKCDITSIKYQGVEYQNQDELSHLASGLGDGTSISYSINGKEPYAIVTCTQDNDNFDLVQYHVFVDGDDQIYLGTYTNKNPSVGELRFLFQLDNLKQAYPFGNVSETRNGEIIESKDIWLVEGETRAKHYSADRFIDDHVSCAYNDDSSVHACFVKPLRGYEASTGGPFARDINLNVLGDYQSVTYYMNHGDSQDAIRLGFHGPYIFSLSGSEIPTPDDFDIGFIEGLGLPGYVPDKERGTVKGTAFGVQDGFRAVLHWWNDKYQTWTYASDDGSFESPLLPAGDYTQTLYQEELEIGSRSVTVKAGGTVAADIEASSVIVTESRNTVFQIGVYDGTPKGFRNADKQPRMHPSDARMDDWDTETFVVGSSQDDDFPMAIFADMNDDREVQFSLEKGLDAASVLRIATTIAYAGARPQVTANEFECEIPAGPSNTSSRGITKGKSHGDMSVYTYNIPAGTFQKGTNTIIISVASGQSGEGFLSPNFMLDAIELYY